MKLVPIIVIIIAFLVYTKKIDVEMGFVMLAVLFALHMMKSDREGFSSEEALDNEGLANLSSMYKSGVLKVSSLEVTGDAVIGGTTTSDAFILDPDNWGLDEHPEGDGVLYRYDGNVYLSGDDVVNIRSYTKDKTVKIENGGITTAADISINGKKAIGIGDNIKLRGQQGKTSSGNMLLGYSNVGVTPDYNANYASQSPSLTSTDNNWNVYWGIESGY